MVNQPCPRGFVIPDDPNSPENIYINQTISECAVSCYNPPFYTPYEFDIFLSTGLYSAIAASLCAFVVLYLWLQDTVKSKQIFVVTSGAVVSIGYFFVFVTSIFDRKCTNNANPITTMASVCAIEGAVNYCIYLMVSACFCFQSLELYRKIVMGARDDRYKWVYVRLLIGLPILFVSIGFGLGFFGPGGDMGDRYCGIHEVTSLTRGLLFIPMVIAVSFGILLCLGILRHVIRLVRAPTGVPGLTPVDAAVVASTSLRFLIFTGFYLLSTFTMRNILSNEDRKAAVIKWGNCCLTHMSAADGDGDEDDESYFKVCGDHPHRNLSFGSYIAIEVYFRVGVGLFFLLVNIEGVVLLIRQYICKPSVAPISTGSASSKFNLMDMFAAPLASDASFLNSEDGGGGIYVIGDSRFRQPLPRQKSAPESDSDLSESYEYVINDVTGGCCHVVGVGFDDVHSKDNRRHDIYDSNNSSENEWDCERNTSPHRAITVTDSLSPTTTHIAHRGITFNTAAGAAGGGASVSTSASAGASNIVVENTIAVGNSSTVGSTESIAEEINEEVVPVVPVVPYGYRADSRNNYPGNSGYSSSNNGNSNSNSEQHLVHRSEQEQHGTAIENVEHEERQSTLHQQQQCQYRQLHQDSASRLSDRDIEMSLV